ncbi:ATP-dependent helicase [Corynebacterium diphtheriae bv. gravis]|uniref:ATP-dependent helicase HrpB n=1 Tax=Corynebacterium diphtheriae TaxID=1717 RepID=UPI00064C6444|nr:ATP-dependent helicase HrpB [Corynebacterium diphtheriae]KLN42916.1 helicase [Corynebacterium diphtheriae bv. gravis str. ISS 4060]OWM45618.1 ATP-dependent helicase HrpB [Corynebacterium diphtheriae]OWN74508.1 ATP-dependent helicase [Corynebacterium diphtheriae bv. gravis]OWO27022.1 ATP-dependent helicase [Corynebacterium diphtheriae bv. mitis]OWO34133.1 ATP-dependent helicase [Corynebacterium diphtheriae bv. gravis]
MSFNLSVIGAGLPVAQSTTTLIDALRTHRMAVVQAPPGTGKTTLVPPIAHNVTGGRVIVVAPRRVAVRAAAHHLVQLDQSSCDQPSTHRVGYTIRGERSRGDLVEFVTPGVLLRRLISNPELDGVSAVVVDEVHERQLDTDLVLGMLVELRELRDDLTVIAMSATVDAPRFAELLSPEHPAPIVETHAEIHPLELHYQPAAERIALSRSYMDHVCTVTQRAVAHSTDSALVFLPTIAAVTTAVSTLEQRTSVPVYPLHGQLTSSEQDAALRAGRQRIVVATSIAESSLTVPGVRIVIDAGLSRVPKRDRARDLTGLVTTSTSQAQADQRAGRAGREGPGTVYRLYSAAEFQHFPDHVTPEIRSADLTQAALFLAAWGCTDPAQFPLLSAPPKQSWEQAVDTLRDIGALNAAGQIAELGRMLATLPTDPRLGASLLHCGGGAAPTIAALSLDARGDIPRAIAAMSHQQRFTREVARLAGFVPDSECTPGEAIARAWPKNVARRDGDSYLMAGGSRAELGVSSLSGHEWLAVAQASLTHRGSLIRSAAPISEAAAVDIIGVAERTEATLVDGSLRGMRIHHAGAITLSTINVKVEGELAEQALAEGIRTHGLELFTFSDKATELRDRLRHLHEYYGEPWPDVNAADPTLWLGPEIAALAAGTPAARIDLYPALQRLLPWPEATRLDELAPAVLELPNGRRARISYAGDRPVLSTKLQDCFGLLESPIVCGRPLQFHLLSPAGRPLAVTDTLDSFWAGPYQQVRSDMRGRYPKHPWPEDPLAIR